MKRFSWNQMKCCICFAELQELKLAEENIPVIKENAPENLIIQVDGGINNLTAKICTSLGANSLVAGNYIYKSTDYRKAIENLIN